MAVWPWGSPGGKWGRRRMVWLHRGEDGAVMTFAVALASGLALANLALIGALPRVFFRRDGRRNRRWWLTAAPFFLAGAAVTAGLVGALEPLAHPLPELAFALHVVSIVSIGLTLVTHRVPLAL